MSIDTLKQRLADVRSEQANFVGSCEKLLDEIEADNGLWINVEDELPWPGDFVICYGVLNGFKVKQVIDALFVSNEFWWASRMDLQGNNILNVTHWQKHPRPPTIDD